MIKRRDKVGGVVACGERARGEGRNYTHDKQIMRRRRKAIVIFAVCLTITLFLILLSSNGTASTGSNSMIMAVAGHETVMSQRNVIPPIDHELYKRYEEEASQVSARNPAHDSSNSNHLWIELDHKRTLIRRTAFYDGRTGLRGTKGHSIVIISLHNDRDEPVKPVLYIKLFYNNSTVSCLPLEYWKQIGGYKPILKDYYGAYLMHVPLNTLYPISAFVAIARDSSCSREQLLLVIPVHADINDNKNGMFSVCTGKALYGDIDPQWVVHWIELNLALGATYITILVQDIAKEVYETVLPYQEEGVVELVDWKISIIGIHEKGMWGSLQECIYRNINRAQYLNLHDIDEVLMPQRPYTTWKEMMNTISDINDYASFSFPNAYWFDIGFPVQLAQDMMAAGCEGMKLPEYFQRTDRSMNPEYQHPKPMLALDSVIASDIHVISEWRNDKVKQLLMPTSVGQSFHYRTPIRREDYQQHNRTYDPSFMLPYVVPIMNNLKGRFCNVQ